MAGSQASPRREVFHLAGPLLDVNFDLLLSPGWMHTVALDESRSAGFPHEGTMKRHATVLTWMLLLSARVAAAPEDPGQVVRITKWFAPAGTVRTHASSEWDRGTIPAVAPANAVPETLEGIRCEAKPDQLSVTFPNPGRERGPWSTGLTKILADTKGTAQLPGGGEVRVVAWASQSADGTNQSSGPPHWRRAPDGHPVSLEALQLELGNVPSLEKFARRDATGETRIKLVVQTKGIPNPKCLGIGIFDSRTHGSLLKYGDGYRPFDNPLVFEMTVSLWHRGPVSFVFDLAHGEFAEQFSPVIPDSELAFSDLRARFVHLANGISVGASFRYEDPGAVTVKLRQQSTAGSVGVFAFTPSWRESWCDVGFRDGTGKIHLGDVGGQHHVGYGYWKDLEAEQAKEWFVRERPAGHRVVFSLPGFPDLPNPAPEKANVFALKVPWKRFSRLQEISQFLQESTQLMGFHGYDQHQVTTGGAFPMEFKNATVADIAQRLVDLTGVDFKVDLEEERVRLE